MERDEITGVEETDASESSTEEQDSEELNEDSESYEEYEESVDEDNENKIPQGRFSKVVEERNAERENRLKLEKELELYKSLAQPQRREEPKEEIDYSKYMNEDGELDLNSYTRDLTKSIHESLRSELNQESEYEKREQREWAEAVSAYPELAQNERLANLVRAGQTHNIINGKFSKLIDVADDVFAEFGKVREAGADSVRRSEQIQSGAGLASVGSSTARTAKKSLTNADVAKMSIGEYQKALSSGEIERAIKAGTIKGEEIR